MSDHFAKQTAFFTGAAAGRRLAHAYLLAGPAPDTLRDWALALADQLGPEKLVVAGSGIDDVRQLKNWLALTPLTGPRKVAIVPTAHQLTEAAQNALLKMLEEPPPSALLLLLTTWPEALLPTVQSRCQLVRFTVPRQTLLAGYSAADVKPAAAELTRLTKAGLSERLVFAKQISEDKIDGKLQRLVEHWLVYASARVSEPAFVSLVRRLLTLHQTLAQPQFNARLAMENFLINL